MEPTRRSTRLQDKNDTTGKKQNKKGKTPSQSRGKGSQVANTQRSKSNRGKSKSNARKASTSATRATNNRTRSQSAKSRTTHTSGSGTAQHTTGMNTRRSNAGKNTTTEEVGVRTRRGKKEEPEPQEEEEEEEEEMQTRTRSTRSKRKAGEADVAELNRRRSTSAKKVKKTQEPKNAEPATRTTRSKIGKQEATEEKQFGDEPQQEEEEKLEIIEDGIISSEFKKPNKKKVEGTNKKIDKAVALSASADKMTELPPEINVLEILVAVKGNGYSIWRKMLVSDEIPFTKFARIIVSAMGWMGYRSWEFKIQNTRILVPPDDDDDREPETETKKYGDSIKVEILKLTKDDKISFIYGTEEHPWVHEILIEQVHKVERNPKGSNERAKSATHGVIVTGMNSCPRDDFNPKEYEKAFDAFKKGVQDYKEWKDKLGEYFNPETFDKEKLNRDVKIHVYDDSKMDPELREEDKMFKW